MIPPYIGVYLFKKNNSYAVLYIPDMIVLPMCYMGVTFTQGIILLRRKPYILCNGKTKNSIFYDMYTVCPQ